ncbi:PdxA family protein [Saccharospirillum sp.]|uniref:PdxA family protein n=1 Tax=Saccharospirillum sp. TaxID=2033801 RepID=UPI0034A07879
MSDQRPTIAMPIGDPAGIGPEVVLKALLEESLYGQMDLIVVGEVEPLRRHIDACQLPVSIDGGTISLPGGRTVPLHVVPALEGQEWRFGEVSSVTGLACYRYASAAIELAKSQSVNAVVAAPHTEAAVNAAGIHFRGYPGLVAELTGTPLDKTFLMLMSPIYRVVNVTLHEPLKDALLRLDGPLILNALRATRDALIVLGLPEGRIGVCGLNPHAGEGGLMGTEEGLFIQSAIDDAVEEGINAHGPYGADALFADRAFDAYLAMYHDQGHIPIKVASPRQASAITIGTPVLFGSVAHGSALDIAGKGLATPAAVIQALKNLANSS